MLRKMMITAVLMATFLVITLPVQASPSLSNDDVATLSKAGVGEDAIISAIQTQDASFDVSVPALLKLKQDGVTPNVLRAMITAMSRKGRAPATPSALNNLRGTDSPADLTNRVPAVQAVPAPAKKSWVKTVGEAAGRAMAAAKSNVAQGSGRFGSSFSQLGSSFRNGFASNSPKGGGQPSGGYGFGNSHQEAMSTNSFAAAPQTADHYTPSNSTMQPVAATSESYGASSSIAFTSWQDPREGAFTLSVPQGWQVSGGIVRHSAIDPHPVVRATSPDHKIQVFYGDPNLIPREVPNQLTAFARIREGQTTKGAWGGPVLMARYESGEQFAHTYISQQLCRAPQITRSGIVQAASRQLSAAAMELGRAQGTSAQAWVGETDFRCGAQTGYVRASTVLAGSATGQGMGMWFIYELDGFMAADPSQAAIARYVMNSMVGSYKTDPQWEARQAQTTRDVTGAVTRAQEQMAATIAENGRRQAQAQAQTSQDIMSGWEARNKVMDGLAQRDSDVRRGTTTATDDYTGTSHTVSNDYNYYWTRPDGTVQGTNTYTPPDYNSGWRPMSTNQ
jgi:hypothetical protein